jgi:thiosulfate dehydrogenase [quinone] large subunit
MKTYHHYEIAVALLRIALGINIFLHGCIRLGGNYQQFIDWTVSLFEHSPLPSFMVQGFAMAIPPLETLIGLLLILGIFTLPALISGTLIMTGLMAGMCIIQKWEIVGLQMLYILLYVLLIFTVNFNKLSIDQLLLKRK